MSVGLHTYQNKVTIKSKGPIQLFPRRVFDLHGCPHVGFIQSRGLERDIVPIFLEFNGANCSDS